MAKSNQPLSSWCVLRHLLGGERPAKELKMMRKEKVLSYNTSNQLIITYFSLHEFSEP